jgi:hypothetical protein
MGDSKRRKELDPAYGSGNAAHLRDKELYKKYETKLSPDLGMQLFPDHVYPFQLLVHGSIQVQKDRYLGTTILGCAEMMSISRVDEHPLCLFPMTEAYVFSIYFGRRLNYKESSEMVSELTERDGLIVIADPSQKYLTPNKSEWVLPLKFLSCGTRSKVISVSTP